MRSLKHIAAVLADAIPAFRRETPDSGCDCAASAGGLPSFEGREPATAETSLLETGALVRHIVARYHEVHRREMRVLVRLARRVEAGHRDHPAAPRSLADLLARVLSEMEQHMKKEELGLFPMMPAGHSGLGAAIAIMRDEHDDHGERLRRIEALTNAHTPPEDACPAWRALYSGTRKFADDLREHIDLEERVLFPRFVA